MLTFLIRTAYPEKRIKVEALLNYISKRFDPSTHVGLTANNEYVTQFCQIIMAQEPVYGFVHKLASGITIE